MKHCVICQSTIEKGQYCDAHQIAHDNLKKKFPDWQKAYGKLTWKEYLTKMSEDEDIPVGDWAREVADYLLKHEK